MRQISFVFQNVRVYRRPVGLKQLQAPCSRLEEGVPGGDREERSSKQSLMLNSCRPSGMQLMRLRVLLALGIYMHFVIMTCCSVGARNKVLVGRGTHRLNRMSSGGWCPGPDDGSLAETYGVACAWRPCGLSTHKQLQTTPRGCFATQCPKPPLYCRM